MIRVQAACEMWSVCVATSLTLCAMAANLLDAPLPHIFFAHDCRNNPGAEANGFHVVDSLVIETSGNGDLHV
jgi:hypothetical protein